MLSDREKLRSEIKDIMKKYQIPGIAISVVGREKVLWEEGFGYTGNENTEIVTPRTLFSIQSISKTYTAVACLRMVDKGYMDLDCPLIEYLPDFTVKTREMQGEPSSITIRQLLSHRAGLHHEAPVGNNYDPSPCSFKDHIESIYRSWLRYPVGSKYSYSNMGFDLVGYAMSKVFGKTFAEVMQEILFEPLEMKNTTCNQDQALSRADGARGHFDTDEALTVPVPMIPAGGQYSTVEDMGKFIRFLLNRGEVNGSSILDPALIEEMEQPAHSDSNYGLGAYRLSAQGKGTEYSPFSYTHVGHNGGGYGYSTSQTWLPEKGLGVVVLTNQYNNDGYQHDLALDILNIAINGERREAGKKLQQANQETDDLKVFSGVDLQDYYFYSCSLWSNLFHFILIRSGFQKYVLYGDSWSEGITLIKEADNLYFSLGGDILQLEEPIRFNFIPLFREDDPYGKVLKLMEKKPEHGLLRERSLSSLARLYYRAGQKEKGMYLMELNVKRHPHSISAITSLRDMEGKT